MKTVTLEDKYENFLRRLTGKSFQQLMNSSETEQEKADSELMRMLVDGTPEESLMADYIIGKWGQCDNGKLK